MGAIIFFPERQTRSSLLIVFTAITRYKRNKCVRTKCALGSYYATDGLRLTTLITLCGHYRFYCRYQCWRRSANVKQTIIRVLLSDRAVHVRDGDEEVPLAIIRIIGAIRMMYILTHNINCANEKGEGTELNICRLSSVATERTEGPVVDFRIYSAPKGSWREKSLRQEKKHRTLTIFSGLKSNLSLN